MFYVDLQHRVYAHLGRVCFTCLSRKSVSCVNLHASCARLFCLSVHCVQLARVCYMSIVRIDCTRRLDVSASRASFDACLLCVSAICIRCTRPFNVFRFACQFQPSFSHGRCLRLFHASVPRERYTGWLHVPITCIRQTCQFYFRLPCEIAAGRWPGSSERVFLGRVCFTRPLHAFIARVRYTHLTHVSVLLVRLPCQVNAFFPHGNDQHWSRRVFVTRFFGSFPISFSLGRLCFP